MRIIRLILLAAIILSAGFINVRPVKALGGYLTGDYGQVAPIEIKAIIDFDGKTETLISSQTFAFNPLVVDGFYWVFALPKTADLKSMDSKKYLKKDPFLDLDKLTQKKFSKDNFLQKIIYADIAEEKFEPPQIFSREVNIKYIDAVPEFKKVSELNNWLKTNSYPIPKNSEYLFDEYLKKDWRIFNVSVDALHLEYDARDSLSINGAHNVPLEVKFATEKIIYPLKLLRIQPDRDSIKVPLSFTYGSNSQDILGVKDSRVDSLLSSPSSNLYPPLLLDLMNIKIDLYVKADYQVESKGFTTIFADQAGDKKLTRLVSYKPITQLEDIELVKAKNQTRINPRISIIENALRVFAAGIIVLMIMGVFIQTLRLRRYR